MNIEKIEVSSFFYYEPKSKPKADFTEKYFESKSQSNKGNEILKEENASVSDLYKYFRSKSTTFDLIEDNKSAKDMLKEKIEEISEKIKNGETEESFQIGACSFTIKEWDKFLEKFDSIQEEIKKAAEEKLKAAKKRK